MVFVETSAFTKRLVELLDDESYAELQSLLAQRPEAGDVIRGSGGIRKLRWSGSGRGKRGGVRVIYYWWVRRDRISMLHLYAKNERTDLTAAELKLLSQILETAP